MSAFVDGTEIAELTSELAAAVAGARRSSWAGVAPRSISSAPARKQSAPNVVPAFAIAALTGSEVDGSTSDVTAATPNAIEPSMLSAAICHSRERARQQTHRWQTAASASSLATRKQTEPNASGLHTRRSVSSRVEPVLHPRERAHVEEQRPGELDERRQPVAAHGPRAA